jgi:hypothetical protein
MTKGHDKKQAPKPPDLEAMKIGHDGGPNNVAGTLQTDLACITLCKDGDWGE